MKAKLQINEIETHAKVSWIGFAKPEA